MPEHTKGPWTISSPALRPVRVPAIGITAAGRWINLAGVYRTKQGQIEAQANADLICAAPDLYAACEAMLRHIDQVGDDEDLSACRGRICAALAKARGEVADAD